MEIITIRSLGEFSNFEKDVNRLIRLSKNKNLYLTFGYIYSWLTAFNRYNINFFFVKDQERVIGFCPLVSTNKNKKIYEFAGRGLWGYSDFLIEPGYENIVVETVFKNFFRNYLFSILRIEPLHEKSASLPFILNFLERSDKLFDIRKVKDAPRIETTTNFEKYADSTLTKKATLPDINRCIKRLHEIGNIKYEIINSLKSEKELVLIMDRFFELYFNQWERNRFIKNPRFKLLYNDFIKRALEKGFGELSLLWLNDKIIAIHYGFLLNSCRYYFTPTYDISYKKYSPGKILLLYLIKDAFVNKYEFDFQNEPEPYKLDWTNDVQGRVFIEVYSNSIAQIRSKIIKLVRYRARLIKDYYVRNFKKCF